jgi:tetratricopeptide (TPR) repeat protein
MFLERQEKAAEAAASLTAMLDSFPDAPIHDLGVYQLGRMLRHCGRSSEAVTLYTAFLGKNPESILRDRFLFYLAETYDEDLRDTGKALEYYQRVLTEHPESIHTGKARERVVALRGARSNLGS